MNSNDEHKIRLDLALVEREISKTRSQALDLIKRAQIRVNGEITTKQSLKVSDKDMIELLSDQIYVGRGALKLEKAIRAFELDIERRVCLDVGASTGGFTQVLLRHGAEKVYAVDIGRDQLAGELKKDPRVLNLEQTNILDLKPIDPGISLVVIDVSFVSIHHIFPYLFKNLNNEEYIVLFKPQFEVGVDLVGKKGIVSELNAKNALNHFIDEMKELFYKVDWVPSPIKGKKGNSEFLVSLKEPKK